ncbi:MAG: FadR family transcriptional regulator [Planctomycetes bacterium]|nr:FadR family transcriptional regulator [Planctomycetota bacterium]MCD7896043.1 FadR family transcriptional regulator [Planctomycetaceae bacterium]
MAGSKVLNKIKGVQIVKPSDHVIQQFRDLITNKELRPGDVLPSERELAASFGIGRGYIREAIKTLELYGVFRSVPGVGTIVADLGVQSINEFINNLVQFGVHDYVELVEVRSIIEPFNAYRAAFNATDEELETIGNILEQLTSEITNEHINVQLEVDFHLEIAKASHNRIFANTISAILPGMIRMLNELDLGLDGRYISSNEEHKQIYDALVKRNPHAAERAMSNHMAKAGVHFSTRIPQITMEKRSSRRISPSAEHEPRPTA